MGGGMGGERFHEKKKEIAARHPSSDAAEEQKNNAKNPQIGAGDHYFSLG